MTESDLKALCNLNKIEYKELDMLDLENNNLINLDFIQENTPFINLKVLHISYNEIKDINNIKYSKDSLEELTLSGLNLKNEKKFINILKNMSKLKKLYCFDDIFKTYTYKQLKRELLNIKNIYK